MQPRCVFFACEAPAHRTPPSCVLLVVGMALVACRGGRRSKATGKSSGRGSALPSSNVHPSPLKKSQQKRVDKSTDKFGKAVKTIFQTDNDEEAKWCKQQIEEHPDWVPYLASLFRRGTFKTMLRKDVDNRLNKGQEATPSWMAWSLATWTSACPWRRTSPI